jgi:predicted transcriptional regulator
LTLSALSVEEGVVFNAEISAAIEEGLARADYGRVLAAGGITTVALDERGQIVEHHPDGTSVVVD